MGVAVAGVAAAPPDRRDRGDPDGPDRQPVRPRGAGGPGDVAAVPERHPAGLARSPRPDEREAMAALFRQAGKDRRGAVEDALWALMNTREFVYNH